MDDLDDYVTDDELTIEPLNKLGWEVETISWRVENVDWSKFEAVIIRTTWDYQNSPKEFLDTLQKIENATRLENPLEIVKWNLSKTYLQDLQEKGVKTVPTIFSDDLINENLFLSWLEEFDTNEIIIKPIVSATAQDTFRVKKFLPEITDVFRNRKYMVQPFMRNIVEEGEYSLFYFGGNFSHVMLKTPKQNDFRVQEDFGGINKLIDPSQKMLKTAKFVLEKIGQKLLYARVDLVRDEQDDFALMELELIEPALYFRMDADSPKRFARVFDEWMR